MAVSPVSAEEVAEAVKSHPRVCAVGGRTKSALVGQGEELELSQLSGITAYEASDYTVTVKAGSPVEEVAQVLTKKGQYMPFDPLFSQAGATLGGTVASGASGPGRFRYGGLRDFLIGVQFVDGKGELVRSGGRVVKNAAGFDLPKFMVGSMGRFGIMTELTFKVFPQPSESISLKIMCPDHEAAVKRLREISLSRWEADTLDYDPGEKVICLRFDGPEQQAISQICEEVKGCWPGEVMPTDEMEWSVRREVSWAEGKFLVKVPASLARVILLAEWVDDCGGMVECRVSSGGNVAWLSFGENALVAVEEFLREQAMTGLILKGARPDGPWLGQRKVDAVSGLVKEALDPDGRFPEI
jgi:glycolate oxidase FAD binding subunit